MDGWCWADVWECIADQIPDAPALIHGDRRVTWADFDRRADGVARALLDAGAQHQDKFAQYLYNGPEYLESVFAACKAGLAPVNTNYRYADDELVYLWDNADVVAVAFHGCFTERIEGLRARVPRVRTWLWVDDGSGPCPDWAVPYEDTAKSATERTAAPWGRRGDDLYLLYTGGTSKARPASPHAPPALIKARATAACPRLRRPSTPIHHAAVSTSACVSR